MLTSSKIEELKKQRAKTITYKKSQLPYGICIIVIALAVYGYFIQNHFQYSSFWIIGILIGITMNRSRFCFAASFRDPIMVGSTSLLKAVIIGLMISTVGFWIIQYIEVGTVVDYHLSDVPGQIHPVGIHTALGAIIFGIGMVIAGGCASGTLIRIGEGYMMQIIVLIGFIIGTTLGGRHFEFWDRSIIQFSPTVYFPQHIGFIPSLLLQLGLLSLLYWFADWYGKQNSIMADL